MAWTEEQKKAKSEAMKARNMAKHDAVQEPNEDEAIVEVEQKEIEAPAQVNLLEEKPDLSKLSDDDKMQSLLNLIKVLPEQYRQNREMLKENVYNLARFTPTDAMLDTVLDGAYVAPQRFPN
jgi:hypothetical protein